MKSPARQAELLAPDCCNIGVLMRTLLAVNLLVFCAELLRQGQWRQALFSFLELAMLLEWATLLLLFALCALRRLLQRLPALPPAWAQRGLCLALPALLAGGMIAPLQGGDWFASTYPQLKWWSAAIGGAVFGLAVQHYYELRNRAFSPVLVEARLQALQARIRPHFLFNSLNAVLSMIRSEPLRAETTLEDLADLFRVLMRDARDLTTLGEEIKLCRQYLSIEKIRLGERLQVRWDMTNTTDGLLRRAQMPALLLQPLLENAVHYGIEPYPKPGLITVRITRSIDRIEIVIINPCDPHKEVESGNQMALGNIRERLALLYDVEAQLTHGVVDGSYEVRLRFPYVRVAQPSAAASNKKTGS
ncbi:histidine kinase [Massilia sp. W12]|uniref:sensor histidine kinase n=1 Tax=Massilia sp. W12 TaxID=3126507 RepID=UPI0030CBD3F8